MPSDKILAQKQQIVADLKERVESATSGVLVDYKGISVADDTQLRRDLRSAGVQYEVIKNRLLLRAIEGGSFDALKDVLTETTALAVSVDPVAPAKILCQYAEKSKGKFKIKAGFVDGKVLDAATVTNLSKLPDREVLVAQVLGGLNAPISGLVNVLGGNIRGLAVALQAIVDQKSA